MKRFTAVLFGLLCLPAYAEVVPADYWAQNEEIQNQMMEEQTQPEEAEKPAEPIIKPVVAPIASPRTTASRSATRAVAAGQGVSPTRTVAASRAVASRNSSASIRSMANQNSGNVTSRQSAAASNPNAARVGIVQTNTVSEPLYISSGTRVGVRTTATTAARVGSLYTTSASTTAADVGTNMEELAQLTDFCKAQYFSCMDNFCDILDDNQGRCSCSANIDDYQKVEDALKSATEELQNVALQIQYLGLTKEEVVSLFTQTEAEIEMSGTQDTTDLKEDLDAIQKLIVDIKPATSTYENTFGIDFTNFDFTTDSGIDLSSLFGTSNTISNQRGEDLYKTAVDRCKTSVLDSCKNQGVDTDIITNGYDLEIDKQCIVYERALDDSNTQMRRTIRNATSVLQKARLTVAKNKNTYDVRGCVSALDECMQSDFVCGSDYDKCLDPTGRYIVDGEIVSSLVSGDLYSNLSATWGTDPYNAWDNSLAAFIGQYLGASVPDQSNMIGFLETKIGRIENDVETGMCMSVLKKCQKYTFTTSSGDYNPTNDVVREYMTQVLTQIKTKQDMLIEDFVSSCQADVISCLTNNGAIIGDSGLNVGYVSVPMYNACKTLANTCAGTLTSISSAAELIQNIACYTASGDEPPYASLAWTIDSVECNCPFSTNWNSATRTCVCPSGSNWNYDTGRCDCTAVGEDISWYPSSLKYICTATE